MDYCEGRTLDRSDGQQEVGAPVEGQDWRGVQAPREQLGGGPREGGQEARNEGQDGEDIGPVEGQAELAGARLQTRCSYLLLLYYLTYFLGEQLTFACSQ